MYGWGATGSEPIEPDLLDGSSTTLCFDLKSSTDMMSSTSSDASLFEEFAVKDLAIGGVYGRGVCRMGNAYGADGRCGLEEMEKFELLLVERW